MNNPLQTYQETVLDELVKVSNGALNGESVEGNEFQALAALTTAAQKLVVQELEYLRDQTRKVTSPGAYISDASMAQDIRVHTNILLEHRIASYKGGASEAQEVAVQPTGILKLPKDKMIELGTKAAETSMQKQAEMMATPDSSEVRKILVKYVRQLDSEMPHVSEKTRSEAIAAIQKLLVEAERRGYNQAIKESIQDTLGELKSVLGLTDTNSEGGGE